MAQTYPRTSDREQLYRFKIDLILGQGGTGIVYRGYDPDSDSVVALKLLRANFFRGFLHQRDVSKTISKFHKLDHVNVVKMHEFITGKEGACIVMEYVDGPDLKWYIAERPWVLEERLVILAQICNALAFIHDKGSLHHDLKPANVLFTRQGTAKICDYSLCSSSGLSVLLDRNLHEQVTPMYVAPEIIQKKKATILSDIYSLGVLMYVMFTDKVPFEVDTLQKVYGAHLHTDPIHPTVVNHKCPQMLGDIVMRLMSKNPERRIQTCDQVRVAIAEIGRSRI
jgi:serine/threonine protein kinase